MGIGSGADQNVPVQVGSASGWKFAESGGSHSIAIDNGNVLLGWGRNNEGQAGIGSFVNQNVPVPVSPGAAAAFSGKLASSYSSVTMQQGQYNIYGSNCNLIASVASSTHDRGRVSGQVTAKVWIESSQPSQYVRRHYEITPANNMTTASGRITLYFSQADFDNLNEISGWLPTYPGDINGIANLRIEKRGGTSSNNSGRPYTYSGPVTTINPVDSDIYWNATTSRWEVSVETSGFSGFFVKATDIVLPVKLQSFEARQSEGEAHLQWQTSAEYNASHFEIQRSTDTLNFETIGRVAAAGNSQQSKYTYVDESFSKLDGNVYYRLRMVDSDSTFAFSRVAVIIRDPELSIYPNPVAIGTSVMVEAKAAISDLLVSDITGRNLSGIVMEPQADNRAIIRLKGLTTGLYLIRFQAGGQKHVRKLWVQ